ncbi:MAG: hypothetical protein IJV44_05620 [Prevotella sp.]|nr:hypothetical protein [Prevotella sp.]
MKYIIGKIHLWLLAIACSLLAVGCSSDHADEQETASTLQVMPYTATYHESDFLMRSVSAGYTAYNPDHDLAIGLYVLPEETPTVKLIRYSSGEWHSQAKVVGGNTYSIYGYMPKKDPITSTISQSGENVVLTLTDIPAVSADDVCVITGVKDMTGDLLQGSFAYEGLSDNNYVRLLLDHLFASVRIHFAIDAEYSALRSIKLKKLTLISTSASATATIVLRPNATGIDPVQSVNYVSTGSTSSAMFFESTTGEDLTSAVVSDYSCCFAPILSNTLTLVSTYDVYDRKGNKIRENCTATNKLPNLSAARGQRVTLDLTVAPTYLGVLSEPDLDNPTFTVN